MSSSNRCEGSSNWFVELNGDWCPRVAVSTGGCVRFLFLTIFQGWMVVASDSVAKVSSGWWVLGGDCGRVGDCECITLQLTCGSDSDVAGLKNWCGSVPCSDGGYCCDVWWCRFSANADHGTVDVVWDGWKFVEGTLLKERLSSALFTYVRNEQERNTSAQYKRHGETVTTWKLEWNYVYKNWNNENQMAVIHSTAYYTSKRNWWIGIFQLFV